MSHESAKVGEADVGIERTSSIMKKIRGAWSGEEGQRAFTLVELLVVLVISVIILGGMVGIVSSVMGLFNQSKDVQALNDSSRRATSSMSRQLRTALHFDNSNCTVDTVTFWADIDNDQQSLPGSPSTTWANVFNYTRTEKVQFLESNGTVAVNVTEPAVDPDPQGTTTSTLGSYFTSLKFYYFQQNVVPGGTPTNPTYDFDPTVLKVNDEVSMIRIVMTLKKGKVQRTYYDDVFLRIVTR